jgi:hypothetical protein
MLLPIEEGLYRETTPVTKQTKGRSRHKRRALQHRITAPLSGNRKRRFHLFNPKIMCKEAERQKEEIEDNVRGSSNDEAGSEEEL